MFMRWRHIMDEQPEDGQEIIHLNSPYRGHWPMGMRTYRAYGSFDDYLAWTKENKRPEPDFWWMPASEFPFPDESMRKKND